VGDLTRQGKVKRKRVFLGHEKGPGIERGEARGNGERKLFSLLRGEL